MAEFDFSRKFPLMTPVKSPPTLFRVNGCGVTIFGNRDEDPETKAYVATWCISLLFVPVLALRAYRVARAPKGWYFLGREPLSIFARAWNALVIVGILGAFGAVQWNNYENSPGHLAMVRMNSARQLADQGHLADAANAYKTLAIAGGDQSGPAAAAVKALIDNQCQTAPLDQCPDVFAAAIQIARRRPDLEVSDIAAAGIKIVAARGDTDPKSALAILDDIRPLVIDTREVDDRRLTLLQKAAAAQPNNLDVIVPLASILADRDQADAAKKLLLPVKDRLGDGEGARVLGSILAAEGDNDGAYALLWPYVKNRLDSFHAAEKSFEDTAKSVEDRIYGSLNNNEAPKDFYDRYNAASGDQQRAIVQKYVSDQLQNNAAYQNAEANFEAQTSVVPVALELGIVMLQRAQEQADPAQRKSQLEAAQNVFLAIQGVAGETDEYRMSLGQVCYWLGKQADGKKLFDDYLSAKNRTVASLLEIASRLRAVGSDADARSLSEEAYSKATTNDDRYSAAGFRAMCFVDLDDQIAWLNKADPANTAEKAELANAMANKAMQEGRNDDAVTQFHAAIDGYGTLPRSASTLNETALAYYGIFAATGEQASMNRCVDYFQQAVDLSPTDTVLLYNAGLTLLDGGLTDVIGKDIDLRALRETGDVSLLGYLYRDQASRQGVIDRVKGHPGIARGLAYLQKVTVLAPKRTDAYSIVFGVASFTRDHAGLQNLQQRIAAAGPDDSQELLDTLDYLKGTKDKEYIAQANVGLTRHQIVAREQRTSSPLTAAVALDDQVSGMMLLDDYGQSVDADQIVALAQDAQTLPWRSATTGLLITAHYFHALKDLCGNNPAFAAFCAPYRRTLSAGDLIAFAASEPGPFQSLVLQNPEIMAAMAMDKQQNDLFPDSRVPQDWALFKNADPALATQAAQIIESGDLNSTEQSIMEMLHPSSAAVAMEGYWFLQLQNKPDQAAAALKKVADSGVPVPVPAPAPQ